MIKSVPIEENPRERALEYGIEILSNIELLAIVLRTGNKEESVLQLSGRLLNEIGGFQNLKKSTFGQLTKLKGIKEAKALEILAIVELSKRMQNAQLQLQDYCSPRAVYERMKSKMMMLKQEHFIILCLDNKNRLLKEKTLFIGSFDMSIVSAREVFLEALGVNGVAFICIHNHPSGDSSPSKEDFDTTQRLEELGEMMNIHLLDHIIIGWNEYYSFKANKKYFDYHN